MLNKIIRFSIENKLIVGLFTVALVIWGIVSLSKLPIDAVPDITNNQVQIITQSPALGAEEVERLITFPIEIGIATIPDIEEVRSFSRFGLSVVTVVFKESVDIYWARQQINERLTDILNEIPNGIGSPYMAPITTGLGEIYQYAVSAAPGYEDQYDAQDLRTIQDWIIKRQLLGTPGVAEVSSFGGYLKQYEIAIDPSRLKAMNVSLSEVFQALEQNNENTGGTYIEKDSRAYYIRSEGLAGDLKDIQNILVKNNQEGLPILIQDLAKVQLGHAVRFGASTENGRGEAVSAVVMMLKGANSAEVIDNIKSKIEEIKTTLPEGVLIEPFLDRTKLVNNAIGTVSKNLIEGAIIVIFVLLLLLGNLRAGLIVASVIPLALLFAFGMMSLFGVSGNLMSLGAIDFGLVVDGAVIIVEATLHHLGVLKLSRKLTQKEMNEEVYQSATKMVNSAAFGEIIIFIVYLPILALVGTEGKMFRPMAQTVSFAILGAFILSLTYVPMVSALFLSKKTKYKENIADKIIGFLQNVYGKLLRWCLHRKLIVLGFLLVLFSGSIWIFSQMGGEFIPTLEEGDFAVETRLMAGSSLENTIKATTEAEKILIEQFPEVEQAVSKIGSGEVPTDPMPMEAADVMVILKDPAEWTSASTREELAAKMGKALEVLPGVSFSFLQPIQMRFNELMTGVKQDVAVKLFGEDLNVLAEYADKIGNIVQTVDGAEDLYVEEVTGVPQILVHYKRNLLSKYGLNIKEVNQTLATAFAGASAGLVFENERRFDLVVRLDKDLRNNIDAVRNLYISRKDGHQIPLYQVADVELVDGPYQIQRENTRRRIIVAFNVRNRDVESVVQEIQQRISSELPLPPGYSVTYGGQFENLQEATQRLSIAVPIALLMIFILLYFTFQSIKQGILIFAAIPFSAIGGILALWFRGMPFSISAGVGFIALFGVAVLNGIVLIAEFNRLKAEGNDNLLERIFSGTRTRLRPVIMTASVASLGFMPMALSSTAGAEVQKPLATVVIGGLISATILTLIVLPILYYFSEKWRVLRFGKASVLLAFMLFGQQKLYAQKAEPLDLQKAIAIGLRNNPNLEVAKLKTQAEIKARATSTNLPKTDFNIMLGQYNSVYANDNQLNIKQSFAFPTVYTRQKDLAEARIKASKTMEVRYAHDLIYQIKSSWIALQKAKTRLELEIAQDSIYKHFLRAAEIRFETGETGILGKTTAQSQVAEVKNRLAQAQAEIDQQAALLQMLLKLDYRPEFSSEPWLKLQTKKPATADSLSQNAMLLNLMEEIHVAEKQRALSTAKKLPDFNVGYFNQSLNGPSENKNGEPVVYNSGNRFMGLEFGVAIPIFGAKARNATIEMAEVKIEENKAQLVATENLLQGQLRKLWLEKEKRKNNLEYFETNALPLAEQLIAQSQKAYNLGEIGYMEYILNLKQAMQYKFQHIDELEAYNQTVVQIEYILGIQ
ncbi:CusA/CzcA family heavy metal efflux RND transporter [Marinilongibacter aquaticus]|uniref:CusA/CzcA family heavy metal efflux RND transporter n=1 Tax=Marinilongibacter aquaticus TaxID=2975157 RepID=UPI0021BD60CB|nr:CusA/CzcA family heavy metal efflux RND transporter [Marinilongibacter aquaticus]UBM60227.1 CusA/CzcA family heavy metal efflux RND transporter [Marinilongibacter aquaticus]